MIFYLASHRFLSLQNNHDFSASDFFPSSLALHLISLPPFAGKKMKGKKISETVFIVERGRGEGELLCHDKTYLIP